MAFAPYWNDCSKEISNGLWLPTRTGLPVSDLTSFNGSSPNLGLYWKAWSNPIQTPERTWSPTSWRFSPSLQPVTTEKESIVTGRRYRIYPNSAQKDLFRKCFGAHRYFYNRAIAEINRRYKNRKEEFHRMDHCVLCNSVKVEGSFCCEKHNGDKLPWKLDVTLASLRSAVMLPDKNAKGTPMEWQTEVPYDTRQLAIKDAITAYKSCTTNLTRGNIEGFQLNYKRRSSRQVCWINDTAIVRKNGEVRIFQQRLKQDASLKFKSKDRRKVPKTFDSDAKILYDRGAYYLVTTENATKEEHNNRKPIVALDPGVRTFQTGYSPTGEVFKAGERHIQRMKLLHSKIDLLRSVRTRVQKPTTRHRITKRLQKIERALYGLVDDLHNHTASALVKSYDIILLPTFGTSGMLVTDDIASDVKRRMAGLSHYRFQQKLKHQCEKHGATLYLVGEEYTTQACGCCGCLKKVAGSKTYTCDNCGYTMDRDVHGARNILLKTCSTFGR